MRFALFLFAHQDDEFAIFAAIEDCVRSGYEPICLYLTNGNFGGQDIGCRNQESLDVLQRLRVKEKNIFFVGQLASIPDGTLYRNIDLALSAVADVINSSEKPIRRIYVPAWEGGHQDHDAAHLIGYSIGQKFGILNHSWQFSLYHGKGLPWLFFRVMKPLKENGPVYNRHVPLSKRLKYLRLCLTYQSQLKSWVGLFPFVAFNYLFLGKQKLQSLTTRQCCVRPHQGPLLYERRGFCHYDEFMSFAGPLIDKKIRMNP